MSLAGNGLLPAGGGVLLTCLLGGCHLTASAVAVPAVVPDLAASYMLPTVTVEPAPLAAPVCRADDDGVFSLADAIAYALNSNPRLREATARIAEARAGETIAFAPFLPNLDSSARFSGFNAQVVPGGSFVPVSLNGGVYSFSLAEAGVQWMLCDFGRTAGRYGQAQMLARIAERQADRAREAVAFEVASGYFRLLFVQAALRVRDQALLQAEAILKDTRVRREGGVADRAAVLRAEVEVSQAQEEQVSYRQQVLDAESALNLAMGRPVTLPIRVQDVLRRPPFAQSLEESLQAASAARPEIDIARRVVAEAAYGAQAAHGELLPKLFIRGTVARADSPGPVRGWITGAGIHLEQPLYAGGRRLGELDRSRARIAAAVASSQSILDNVSHQVNVAFQAIATSRQRIQLGEVAIAQARENLRLTVVKYKNGNATPTDIVDAQTTLTRSETRYYAAVYEYLESLARLEFAQGGDQARLLHELARQD